MELPTRAALQPSLNEILPVGAYTIDQQMNGLSPAIARCSRRRKLKSSCCRGRQRLSPSTCDSSFRRASNKPATPAGRFSALPAGTQSHLCRREHLLACAHPEVHGAGW